MTARDFLYLGRGNQYPIALEGALKLKEISYIHAEGYPAGEMKHGPIALIDEQLPVVIIAPRNDTFEKVVSNMEEVQRPGRQGHRRHHGGRFVGADGQGRRGPGGARDRRRPDAGSHLPSPCSFSPTTSPCSRERTSTSRGTWPRALRWSRRAEAPSDPCCHKIKLGNGK